MTHRISAKIEKLIEEAIENGAYSEEISYDITFLPQQEGAPLVVIFFSIPGAVLGTQAAMVAQAPTAALLDPQRVSETIRSLYEGAMNIRSNELAVANSSQNGHGHPTSLIIPGR
jgi:hypothetical protein